RKNSMASQGIEKVGAKTITETKGLLMIGIDKNRGKRAHTSEFALVDIHRTGSLFKLPEVLHYLGTVSIRVILVLDYSNHLVPSQGIPLSTRTKPPIVGPPIECSFSIQFRFKFMICSLIVLGRACGHIEYVHVLFKRSRASIMYLVILCNIMFIQLVLFEGFSCFFGNSAKERGRARSAHHGPCVICNHVKKDHSASLTGFTQQSVTTLLVTGPRRTLVPFPLPRRWTPASGGRPSVIVLSHPPPPSHPQLHQHYQLPSRRRRRRGRGRAHRPTGGFTRNSSRFSSVPHVDVFTEA
ncbi:Unknown protein, partial [Striga hermonthica]